jgi:L-iditol 2-dehydrogenase
MKIAALMGKGRFAIEEAPTPSPAGDEVLVRVAACGVCSSELDAFAGSGPTTFPAYLGHEVSGTVVEAGPEVTEVAVGQDVGVWVTARGFAEYVAVPARYCRTVDGVPLELALTEPLACAANAVELADVRLADDVVVVGAGFMGNLVQELVALRGASQVIVADVRPDVLERARLLGATRVVQVGAESLPEVVSELTGGRGADITFECTGSQSALDLVGDVTRMSGKIALVGFHQGGNRSVSLAHWNWMAFQVVNAHFRDVSTIMRGMTVAARLLSAGAVSLAPLVTHQFPLDQVDDAFQAALDKPPGFVKAVVTCDGRAARG